MENNINNQSDFLLYTSTDGQQRIDVRLEDNTVCLTQKQLAVTMGHQEVSFERGFMCDTFR